MSDDPKLVSGDSYILDCQLWEDVENTIPRDLTGVKEVVYTLWSGDDFENALFTSKWKEDFYINIPDLTQGRILVDLRGDLQVVKQGQLYHKLHVIDEAGRKTTVLNEYVNIEILPFHK